ncbi:MAG: NUDIX domain-containing protein [Bacilli bacterium]|nr:NUDIX domain-containing protein [Bacilli bacterium]
MRNSKVILTNMCMLYQEDGSFLVIDRKKQDWPGINFPGGHVEDEESIPESVIREMKEETGYDLHSVEECGYFEWNVPKENVRHLAILFRSKDFSGEIHPSKEGEVLWVKEEDLKGKALSLDFDKVLEICKKGL